MNGSSFCEIAMLIANSVQVTSDIQAKFVILLVAFCFPEHRYLLAIDSFVALRCWAVANSAMDFCFARDLRSRPSHCAKLAFPVRPISILDACVGGPKYRIAAVRLAAILVSGLSVAIESNAQWSCLWALVDDWNHCDLVVHRRMSDPAFRR